MLRSFRPFQSVVTSMLRASQQPTVAATYSLNKISVRRMGSEHGGDHELEERLLTVMKGYDKIDPAKVSLDSHFIKDLGMDSMDAVELLIGFEEEFRILIPDDISDKIFTAREALKFIKANPHV